MSFICQSCGKQQETGKRPAKVTTHKRRTHYPVQYELDWRGAIALDEDTNEPIKIASEGFGSEIVKEIDCCEKCAKKIEPVWVENQTA